MAQTLTVPAHGASRWGQYYALTKPRVVQLIVFCAVIGMLLAEPGLPNLALAGAATAGIWLVASAAAAFNCIVEQHIDARMQRTAWRPTAKGQLTNSLTLLFSAATHVLAKQVLANPPYDPQTDFLPVARVGEAPLMLVIPPQAPQKTLKEVLDAARAQPDKWTAAVPALGAPSHLATLLLAKQGHLKLTMTPYKGTAPALADVAGGHVQLLMDSIISIQAMAKSGKVKAIATTMARRSKVAPDVPTAAESGFPGMVYESWYGVWAPKGTPDDRVQLLNKAVNKAVAELEKSGALEALGIEPVQENTEQFRKYVASDVSRSADLLKDAGFKPE